MFRNRAGRNHEMLANYLAGASELDARLRCHRKDALARRVLVSRAFKTGDPNGQGQADEIPLADDIRENRDARRIVRCVLGTGIEMGPVAGHY